MPAGARLLALGVTGALALGACGGDPQPIPRDQAAALIADLEEAKRRVDSGACDDLERGTFVRLDRRVERLPADVDGGVEQALRDGVSHLKNLAEEECPANRPAAPATSTTPEPAPESTTTTQPEQPKGDDTTTTTTRTDPPPKSPEPPSETPGKGKGQPPSDGGSGGTPGQSGQEEG